MQGLAGRLFAAQRMAGEINTETAKRVEASVRTFSDAGSIPAASTIRLASTALARATRSLMAGHFNRGEERVGWWPE